MLASDVYLHFAGCNGYGQETPWDSMRRTGPRYLSPVTPVA